MGTRTGIDWRRCAERLAAVVPRERLHPAVVDWAEKSRADEPWVVAFSGGADSLALLLLVWAHWPDRRKTLAAAHFNHRLRGAAADADEKFCATVCRALRLRWRAGKWTRRKAAAIPSEAEARAARHEFFAAELRRRRARVLWLGHQQDDVAETMLMRLARGSGTGGLAAPRPVQRMPGGRVHVRPLLALKKSEIVAALEDAGAGWCEDATNAEPEFFRNRVRGAVLPAWRRAAGERDALAGAALSRELLEEDDAALEDWLAGLAPVGRDGALLLRRLAGKPRGLVRRALHAWLARNRVGAGLSRQAFNALLADVMRSRLTRHSVGADVFAEIGRVRVRIVPLGGKKRAGFHRRAN